jgi:hypothetical protein
MELVKFKEFASGGVEHQKSFWTAKKASMLDRGMQIHQSLQAA